MNAVVFDVCQQLKRLNGLYSTALCWLVSFFLELSFD